MRCCLPLVVVILLVASAAAEEQLRGVVLLHRHGARNTMGVVNGSLVCSGNQYCQLTNEGKAMCRSLGRVMSEYRTSLNAPPRYNVSFMLSNSTNYPRVVVSAEAMVMGMYEDLLNTSEPPLPFVDFVEVEQDIMMVPWHAWPSWLLHNNYDRSSTSMNAEALATFGQAHLDALGLYFGLEELCQSSPMDCIGYVQDAICCNISAGDAVPAWILTQRNTYREVVSKFLFKLLGYNMSDSFNQAVGSYGYPWAWGALWSLRQMAQDGYDGVRVQHAAAHDWTLLAVYSALGMYTEKDAGNTTFVPRFAEALIMEVWVDDNGVASVRPRWGYPTQEPGSHEYTFKVANVTCQNVTHTYYAAENGGACLLADLLRFVESTGPQAATGGVCYTSDEMLSDNNCDGDDAPPVGSRCYFYRQTCPAAACGTTVGALADPARGYLCQPLALDDDNGSSEEYLGATIVALVAPSLLAGAIGGFYFSQRLKHLLWGSSSDKSEEEGTYKEVDDAGASETTPIAR